MVNEKFATLDIKHIPEEDVKNATTINTEQLFANQEEISAEYLLEHLDEMSLSSDPGIRKLAQLLDKYYNENLYDELRNSGDWAQSYISYENFINALIQTINQECGIENSTPPTLSKEAINKLNTENLFDKLKEIAKSDECYKNGIINGINGEIDEFRQGGTGDCWLLAGLKALASTKEGKELINKQIKWADDFSSVTIYFAGKDKYITVTIDEIIAATKDLNDKGTNSQYSKGDIDVLVIELAMQKLMGGDVEDIEGDNSRTFWKAFVANADIESDSARGIDDFFNVIGNFFGAGGRADLDSGTVKKILKEMYNKQKNGENIAMTFSFGTFKYGKSEYYCTTVDGQKVCVYDPETSWIDFSGHVFTITELTEDTVTFTDPHNTENKKYTVTWEEFAKMHVAQIESVTFDNK